MPDIKTEIYKGFKYKIWFDTNDNTFHVNCNVTEYLENKDIDILELEVQNQIDNFISKTPKNWDDLACKIEETIIYSGYCDGIEIDTKTMKTLILNFIKSNNHKK